MTDERRNEFWAMLTQAEKDEHITEYNMPIKDGWDRGYKAALRYIYGDHNLKSRV